MTPLIDNPGHRDLTPEERLATAAAAFRELMDEVVTESQHYPLGRRPDLERIAYLSDVIDRATAPSLEPPPDA